MAGPSPDRRWLRRLKIAALLVLLAVAATVVAPVAAIEGLCSGAPAPAAAARSTSLRIDDPGYKRAESRTYFTFPEWYIVYSFEDFGKFLDGGRESGFPYAQHIIGFWRSFCTINRTVGRTEESTLDVKVMIYTIGVSYTAEYAIKGLYENTLGRMAEWTAGDRRTPEDEYARRLAQDYAAFLYAVPWYKYPFFEKVRGLWRATPLWGPDPIRSWERKLALSTEWSVKSAYAWLIEQALEAADASAETEIMMAVRTLPQTVLAREPRIRVVRALDAERQLILTPRYQEFTDIVISLARAGQTILEIAGNDEILATVILPDGPLAEIAGVQELFSLPLGARPGYRRAGLRIEVAQLAKALRELERRGTQVEHLYDY